jgi:lysophospholipid acyltransferase (LPLAT)-like uncharacterized protein
MKLRSPFLIRLAAMLGAWLIRLWMGTVRYRWDIPEGDPHPQEVDPHVDRFIYTLWHDTMMFPTILNLRLTSLISKHADGELIARVFRHLGLNVVRGSTTDGGAGGVLGLARASRRTHLGVTPDGPRGPRHQVKAGVVYLAACTGLPVVPCGIAYSRAWRLRSWDRFALPRPWSTGYCVVMPPIRVPRRLDRAALEHYRRLVEEQLLWATEAAEHWAARGGRRMPLPRPPRPPWPTQTSQKASA